MGLLDFLSGNKNAPATAVCQDCLEVSPVALIANEARDVKRRELETSAIFPTHKDNVRLNELYDAHKCASGAYLKALAYLNSQNAVQVALQATEPGTFQSIQKIMDGSEKEGASRLVATVISPALLQKAVVRALQASAASYQRREISRKIGPNTGDISITVSFAEGIVVTYPLLQEQKDELAKYAKKLQELRQSKASAKEIQDVIAVMTAVRKRIASSEAVVREYKTAYTGLLTKTFGKDLTVNNIDSVSFTKKTDPESETVSCEITILHDGIRLVVPVKSQDLLMYGLESPSLFSVLYAYLIVASYKRTDSAAYQLYIEAVGKLESSLPKAADATEVVNDQPTA